MQRALIAAGLLLCLVIPALGQGVVMTVTPTDAAFGQDVQVTLHNRTSRAIYYSGTLFNVAVSGGSIIWSPPGGPPGSTLPPGQRVHQSWPQEDNSARQVSPGHYTIILHYGLTQATYATLRQGIVIRDAKITWTGRQAGGSSVYLHLDAPQAGGLAYRTTLSFSDSWGIKLPGGRLLSLVPDALFFLSANNGAIWFHNFAGKVDNSGKATSWIDLPSQPVFRGIKFHAAFLTLSPQAPGGIHSVTRSLALRIQ